MGVLRQTSLSGTVEVALTAFGMPRVPSDRVGRNIDVEDILIRYERSALKGARWCVTKLSIFGVEYDVDTDKMQHRNSKEIDFGRAPCPGWLTVAVEKHRPAGIWRQAAESDEAVNF